MVVNRRRYRNNPEHVKWNKYKSVVRTYIQNIEQDLIRRVIINQPQRPLPVAPGADVGPGDVATFTSFGSPAFALSAAHAAAGGNCMDLVDQAGANPITIPFLSTGLSDVAAIAAWVLADSVTTIKVATLYDHVAGNSWTQNTPANMPTLILSGIRSKPTIVLSNGGASYLTSGNLNPGAAFSVHGVAQKASGNPAVEAGLYQYWTNGVGWVAGASNTMDASGTTATASDGTPHKLQISFVSGSRNSQFAVDGSSTMVSPSRFWVTAHSQQQSV